MRSSFLLHRQQLHQSKKNCNIKYFQIYCWPTPLTLHLKYEGLGRLQAPNSFFLFLIYKYFSLYLMASKRNYDIVVWGATSFTGARLMEYLALNAPAQARIAMGGRNQQKLDDVKQSLSNKYPANTSISEMDILVGDSKDPGRMHEVAKQTKVVASTVGPYALYGTELVKACVAEGTDYCDITGETPWVMGLNKELNQQAIDNNAHIASMCGFDCIPADLGCSMLAEYAREQLDQQHLSHVKGSIVGIKGGVSGGTLATLVEQIKAQGGSVIKKVVFGGKQKPAARSSADKRPKRRHIIHYDQTLKKWQTFWVMSVVNQPTVNWAGRVLGYGGSSRFTYSESMSARSLLHAVAIAAGLLYGVVLMSFAFTRSILYALGIIPRPGQGPGEAFTRSGFFSLNLEAHTDQGQVFYGKVSGNSDPGYGETIKYLGESALCLAFDQDNHQDLFTAGIYPPSVVMGKPLLDRLRDKGCQFDVGTNIIPAALESKKNM